MTARLASIDLSVARLGGVEKRRRLQVANRESVRRANIKHCLRVFGQQVALMEARRMGYHKHTAAMIVAQLTKEERD